MAAVDGWDFKQYVPGTLFYRFISENFASFMEGGKNSSRLGNTVKEKNARLAAVIEGVAGLDFGDFDGSNIKLFGDAYEFLISNYAANAGKSGGEFFTPQNVSRLIARLALHKQTSEDDG